MWRSRSRPLTNMLNLKQDENAFAKITGTNYCYGCSTICLDSGQEVRLKSNIDNMLVNGNRTNNLTVALRSSWY